MRTRRSRVIATATAVLALGILVPVIASGSSAERKVASNSPAATKKPGAGSFQRIQRMAPIDRACSLTCTQRALLKLIKKHNKLVGQFNTLANSVYNCERVQPVTRYTGYDYFGTPGATTALDFTNPGSAVSANMLVYSC
jgi:hypothetical protein